MEQIIIFGILLTLGFVVGTILEKRHYASIREREEQLKHILLFNEKMTPLKFSGQPFSLVMGSVVISGDYFKHIVATLKSLVGGSLTSYESLLDRARREAILRMKQKAQEQGASVIFNVRLETSSLNQGRAKQGIICAEVIAYGTAWRAKAPT